jgi:hypothetical protein
VSSSGAEGLRDATGPGSLEEEGARRSKMGRRRGPPMAEEPWRGGSRGGGAEAVVEAAQWPSRRRRVGPLAWRSGGSPSGGAGAVQAAVGVAIGHGGGDGADGARSIQGSCGGGRRRLPGSGEEEAALAGIW